MSQVVRQPKTAHGVVWQAIVKTIGDNTITAAFYDGTSEGVTVTVARPWDLRRTTYEAAGGYTYVTSQQRTVDADGTTEDVTPSYAVDDVIYIVRPAGGTGVTDTTWLDLNVDARAWAQAD